VTRDLTAERRRFDKSIFEKANRKNLLFGLFDIVLVICAVLLSLHIIGLVPDKNLMLDLLYLGIFLLALGILAGYEIGRYIEMKLGERRASRTRTETTARD
jgi:hypothetical protein